MQNHLIDGPSMSLGHFLITILVASIGLLVLLFIVSRREKHDRVVLDRVKAHPEDVLEIILYCNDPATVEVCFKDGINVTLRHELGDDAVKAYEKLKVDLPEASFRVYVGYREVSGRSAAV